MRPVKYTDFLEQIDADSGAFPFRHLGAQRDQQRLYVAPSDRTARRSRKYLNQGGVTPLLHRNYDTII
jgi:hypothetical protein